MILGMVCVYKGIELKKMREELYRINQMSWCDKQLECVSQIQRASVFNEAEWNNHDEF